MRSVGRIQYGMGVFAALLLLGAGCDGGSSGPPQPAPNFTLTDANPGSPSFGEARQLSELTGRVIVIHFALYT